METKTESKSKRLLFPWALERLHFKEVVRRTRTRGRERLSAVKSTHWVIPALSVSISIYTRIDVHASMCVRTHTFMIYLCVHI